MKIDYNPIMVRKYKDISIGTWFFLLKDGFYATINNGKEIALYYKADDKYSIRLNDNFHQVIDDVKNVIIVDVKLTVTYPQ